MCAFSRDTAPFISRDVLLPTWGKTPSRHTRYHAIRDNILNFASSQDLQLGSRMTELKLSMSQNSSVVENWLRTPFLNEVKQLSVQNAVNFHTWTNWFNIPSKIWRGEWSKWSVSNSFSEGSDKLPISDFLNYGSSLLWAWKSKHFEKFQLGTCGCTIGVINYWFIKKMRCIDWCGVFDSWGRQRRGHLRSDLKWYVYFTIKLHSKRLKIGQNCATSNFQCMQ